MTSEGLEFAWVDAFTDQAFGGNPCAVVFDADALTDTEMLAITREFNLSETVFVLEPVRGDIRARYFTPAEEIPFAGHPTVATLVALLRSGRLELDPPRGAAEREVVLELAAGLIPVRVVRNAADGVSVCMRQLAPEFGEVLDAASSVRAFGLEPEQVARNAPVQIVSTGVPQLMIAVETSTTLASIAIDFEAYRALRARHGFFSAHLFCREGRTATGDTFARHFFDRGSDVGEDPYTGSATGAMGAYLWRHGLIEQPRFVAEQGHDLGRPGTGTVTVLGTRESIEGVEVSGAAVVVARGTLSV